MTSVLTPTTSDDLSDAIADAARSGTRLAIAGGGSKTEIGKPSNAVRLDMRGFAGIIDYDPPELVLTVGAGTPLSEVESLVAAHGQMLAFEPWDHGPLFGKPAGAATIGGVVAARVAGSGRLTRGGARDHLLRFEAISGKGERFVGGAKVVKNVTGYDLPKLMAGSWGRLAAMTQLTLKVLPRPRASATMVIYGLSPVRAHAAMARAMSSHAEVSAAAHIPKVSGAERSTTALCIQGFEPSVAARCALLIDVLRDHGTLHTLPAAEAESFWRAVREVTPLASSKTLWRIDVAPSTGPAIVDAFESLGARWLFDWAGGLIWLAFDGDAGRVRPAAERAGGHAMLVRAPEAMRTVVPAHHPRVPAVAALEFRVRRAFDPHGIFETGRFLDESNAD
ncbi:2-hydroxy-acid oxidase [Steroidobacter agaridevorans]|uniref:2-hydroxy-acid oxidase n=1 Tax=Steroidobacter agaridevorans TaxID=2695856 RepID=A0A829YJH6_9GAMM|nr:FAD-binding protein [Steroidobacter agaridevorans]GFE83435.1 2-hydroxy-acid oxidase [Steroidobacter agaridevorans]